MQYPQEGTPLATCAAFLVHTRPEQPEIFSLAKQIDTTIRSVLQSILERYTKSGIVDRYVLLYSNLICSIGRAGGSSTTTTIAENVRKNPIVSCILPHVWKDRPKSAIRGRPLILAFTTTTIVGTKGESFLSCRYNFVSRRLNISMLYWSITTPTPLAICVAVSVAVIKRNKKLDRCDGYCTSEPL